MRIMLKSKIHRARVTEVNIDYEGSITIDRKLIEEADILPYCHVADDEACNFAPKVVPVDAKNTIIKRVDETIFS